MPQNRHWRCRFFDDGENKISLSRPVEVMVPFDVVATAFAQLPLSAVTVKLLELFDIKFVLELDGELVIIPLRDARLLARAVILRFRSSRRRDFKGDTWKTRWCIR